MTTNDPQRVDVERFDLYGVSYVRSTDHDDRISALLQQLADYQMAATAEAQLADERGETITQLRAKLAEREAEIEQWKHYHAEAVKTIRMGQDFAGAIANEMRAAGCDVKLEPLRIVNKRAEDAERRIDTTIDAARERWPQVITLEGAWSELVDDRDAAERAREEAQAEVDRLRGFAQDVMESWPEGDLDGGYLQHVAANRGLLVVVNMAGSCGDDCSCNEFYREGAARECYRKTSLLTGNPESDNRIAAFLAANGGG